MLERMTGNVFILQLHALMYVVLRMEENPCLMGNWLIPLNVWRYRSDVALTEVVTTESNFTYIISCWFNKRPWKWYT